MHPLSHVDTVMDNGVLSWFWKKLDIDVGKGKCADLDLREWRYLDV